MNNNKSIPYRIEDHLDDHLAFPRREAESKDKNKLVHPLS